MVNYHVNFILQGMEKQNMCKWGIQNLEIVLLCLPDVLQLKGFYSMQLLHLQVLYPLLRKILNVKLSLGFRKRYLNSSS